MADKMSKYQDIKMKPTLSSEEEKEYKKSSITKMIEKSYLKGESIPESILSSINFNEGFFIEYYKIGFDNHQFNMKENETIAQNIMSNLPLSMYEQYMDITWLKTFNDDSSKLMTSLIYRGSYDVIEKFLDLVSKEDKKVDFRREVFEPIFHLSHNLMNLYTEDKDTDKVKNYLKIFNKAIKVWEPFYKQTCKSYKVNPKNVNHWHRNFEYLSIFNDKNKLHDINLALLKNDEFLDFIKDIFNQYTNSKENTYLSKEHFEEAVKNSQEKIVTYYIAELLKNNEMTQEEIEKSIVKAFNEKILEMNSYISSSFRESYNNNYKNTYKIEEIYNLAVKYGNYQPDYSQLSTLLLIDNKEFQEKFFSKIVPEEKITIKNLNINQWKHVGHIVEQIKELTKKEFQPSYKQKENRYPKEHENFVKENPYEDIYIINQINKKYPGKANVISEKELDEVYAFMKENILNKIEDKNFDLDKYRLNNKLSLNLTEKGKVKAKKI